MANDTGILLNFALSFLLRKITVPGDFRNQVKAVKEMQMDDMSGIVDSLTDFAVQSATVDFSVETDNEQLTKILKRWLDTVNLGYEGKIPPGVKPLAEEYFKERWKYSSFPVLKIVEWKPIQGVLVPSKMFFVDGESITAKDKDENDDNLKLINYDYYLGDTEKLEGNVIFARPYGRWFDKYPIPYLIKRGIYHNWKIIQSLKKHQGNVLEQVIPYMMLVKKGSEGLARDNIKVGYSDEELKAVIKDLQELIDKINSTSGANVKTPIRATNFDEDLKHLIPDLSTIFDKKLFVQTERNILAGMGFIDIAQPISDSRRESILNPKAFIEETKSGVEGFKLILKQLIFLIIEKNKKSHKKYVNAEFYITSSPVKAFMTDDFKTLIRSMYDRGRISSQTAIELIAETDFRTEVYRREKEKTQGIEEKMYPQIIQNREGQGIDLPEEEPQAQTPEDENKDHLPEDKKGVEKENYNNSIVEDIEDLLGAPYTTIKSLPDAVKKLSVTKQRKWMTIFNNAYYYKLGKTHDKKVAETYAFRVAWSGIKSSKRRNK